MLKYVLHSNIYYVIVQNISYFKCPFGNGSFENQFPAGLYPQFLKIPGNPLCQFHRFRIQFINLSVYRTHGFLEVKVLIYLFRRYTHMAARGEAPVILFDFLETAQLDEPLTYW